MKYFVSILLLFVVGFTACQRHTVHPLAMQQAESLMNARPDSALALLEGMADTLAMLPEEARMYWHLLTIQARDKLYITHTDDSLVNTLVRYYAASGDAAKLMLAYYYQGRVYRDMNDAPRALNAFQQAENTDYPDNELLTKIYSQKGYLFANQGLYDEAIKVNRKFIDLYSRQNKQHQISFALRDIARMYDAKGQSDSALVYYKEACQTALMNNDSTFYYSLLGELGGLYYNLGNAELSKSILLQSSNHKRIKNKANTYLLLGYIYENMQQLDSAQYYFQKTLDKGNIYKQRSAYCGLSRIYEQSNNYSLAIQYLKKAILLTDSVDEITQTEAIAKVNSLYNYQHTERENHELKIKREIQQRKNLVLLSLLVGGMLFAILLFIYLQKEKQKAIYHEKELRRQEEIKYAQSQFALKDNLKKLAELDLVLSEKTIQLDGLQKMLLESQRTKLTLQNQNIQIETNEQILREKILTHSEIYLFFHQVTADEEQKVTDMHWKELQIAIDSAYPHFTKRVKLLYPGITDIECKTCWLTKISVPPTSIAWLTHRSCSAVSNIRSRLYQKLKGTKGSAKLFCEFIADF